MVKIKNKNKKYAGSQEAINIEGDLINFKDYFTSIERGPSEKEDYLYIKQRYEGGSIRVARINLWQAPGFLKDLYKALGGTNDRTK